MSHHSGPELYHQRKIQLTPNKSALTNMNSQLFHKTPHHTYHIIYSLDAVLLTLPISPNAWNVLTKRWYDSNAKRMRQNSMLPTPQEEAGLSTTHLNITITVQKTNGVAQW
jgi:hypothetical protein